MSETADYKVEQIDALFKGKPAFIRMRYGKGETGWAIDLGDDRAVIANTPFEPRLCYKDVVEKDPPSDCSCCPTAGKVLWRYYARKTVVKYPAPDKETAKVNFNEISKACKDAGLGIEGYVEGHCGVNHHEDTDLIAIFEKAGIDLMGIALGTDWQNDDSATAGGNPG
jgi:hypothetical protein